MDKLLGLTMIILCISAYFNTEWIEGVNRKNERQERSVDSLKVELIRIDSTLKSWDKEYQENLDMSNNLVEELEKYENN